MSEKIINFMKESMTYRKVLDHRRSCKKWGKEYCMKCFGDGLTNFLKNLNKEFKNIK